MVRLLRESPLLLLFVVAGLGYVLGHVKVRGVGLGVAAVLFVGLAIGALDPALALPELVPFLGLVLFVYTIGLGSGPGFFASLAGRGLRDNGLALLGVVLAVVLARVARSALGLDGPEAAGLFAGASTSTPALAAVLDALRPRAVGEARDALLARPVVTYSITYPLGVLGVFAAIVMLRRTLRDEPDAPPSLRVEALVGAHLDVATAHVTRRISVADARAGRRVTFGRRRRGDDVRVVLDRDVLEPDDRVTVIGTRDEIERAIDAVGEPSTERIDLDRRTVDYRRIFVSEPKVTCVPLRELALGERFGAVVTRLRRGDVELLPEPQTELQLGDRVRVIAPRAKLEEVARYFGDSYKALSEIDVITFALGIALGLLLGKLPIPLPGGGHLELGMAGGPLIAGLLLGRLGRLGPMVFVPPYNASLTLRQLGLVLFLAGVGTRAGWAFATALRSGTALPILIAGGVLTFVVASTVLLVGHRVLGIRSGVLLGILAGVQTQPAVLAFASEQTKDDLPNAGYATVYPLATIAKIVLAQVLLGL